MNVIKSKYTTKDIELLYYGPKKMKKKREIIDMMISFISFLSLIIYLIILCVNFNIYASFIMKILQKISFFSTLDFPKFMIVEIIAIFLIFLFGLKIIEKGLCFLSKLLYKYCNISSHPFFYHKYCNLYNLYSNEEEFLSYLKTDEHPSIIIKDQDTVKICIHQQNYAKEYELNFPGMISEIFKDNCIDFSCLDNRVETVFNKKCSDL